MRIGIHQIYYDISQLPNLEPAFIPYDNTANPNREWAEYHVFETEFRKGTYKKFDYTGFVSWKFRKKSRISGEKYAEFIKANPGADVYFLNPFPMEELLFKNVWLQGDFYHSGILSFSQNVLRRAGYDFEIGNWQQPRETFAFCNYWAGNEKFWLTYMDFTGKIAEVLRSGLSNAEKSFLHSIASRTNDFSYIAFIMERMFSVFLEVQSDCSWRRYSYQDSEIRDRFPGVGNVAYSIMETNSVLLMPVRRFTSLVIKASRRGKEP